MFSASTFELSSTDFINFEKAQMEFSLSSLRTLTELTWNTALAEEMVNWIYSFLGKRYSHLVTCFNDVKELKDFKWIVEQSQLNKANNAYFVINQLKQQIKSTNHIISSLFLIRIDEFTPKPVSPLKVEKMPELGMQLSTTAITQPIITSGVFRSDEDYVTFAPSTPSDKKNDIKVESTPSNVCVKPKIDLVDVKLDDETPMLPPPANPVISWLQSVWNPKPVSSIPTTTQEQPKKSYNILNS